MNGVPCKSSRTLALLALTLLLLCPGAAVAGKHVRIILDTSLSMKGYRGTAGNDVRRLAKLATLLFYDLTDPNLTETGAHTGKAGSPRNSFKVCTFGKRDAWKPAWQTGKARPALKVPVIDPAQGGSTAADHRKHLQQKLARLKYNGQLTYFYPGLLKAYEELKDTRGKGRDTRVVVIITDGLPESDTQAEELDFIRKNLLDKYKKSNIQLHVLAFGGVAYANSGFFTSLTSPPGGGSLGENQVDPDGSSMLASMTKIFQYSFGYALVDKGVRPGRSSYKLTGSSSFRPDIALVIAYSGKPSPPVLKLRSPTEHLDLVHPRHLPQNRRGRGFLGEGVGSRAAYTIQKVLHPQTDPYGVGAAGNDTITVLQPVEVDLEVQHPPTKSKGHTVPRVMAGEKLNLTVDVTLKGGVRGQVPRGINIHYEVHYGWHTPGGKGFRESGKEDSARAAPTALAGGGHQFTIPPQFERAPKEDEEFYEAYVDVWAKRNTATVGHKRKDRAFLVHVYPRLSLVPSPLEAGAKPVNLLSTSNALDHKERGCGSFTFDISGPEGNKLPKLSGVSDYPLIAVLDKGVKLSGPLAGANLSLDKDVLRHEGYSGPNRGNWVNGVPLSEDKLRAKHTVCVKLGKQTKGNPAVRVPVQFTLDIPPYDLFKVVQPFTLKINVAEPSIMQRWGFWLFFGLLLLLLLALLWFLRKRPDLPPDMNAGIGRNRGRGEPISIAARDLGSPPLIRSWLGFTVSYPLEEESESLILGHVTPVDPNLYAFTPAPEVTVYSVGEGEKEGDQEGKQAKQEIKQVQLEKGRATLSVRRIYLARTPQGEYNFWVSYK